MRRLAEKKGCFCGRFAEPFAKLILTRTVRTVPGRRKNKKLRNPEINGRQEEAPLTPLQHQLGQGYHFLALFLRRRATPKSVDRGLGL
jgi:hypothetical protein